MLMITDKDRIDWLEEVFVNPNKVCSLDFKYADISLSNGGNFLVKIDLLEEIDRMIMEGTRYGIDPWGRFVGTNEKVE